jgi:hypothetical protein
LTEADILECAQHALDTMGIIVEDCPQVKMFQTMEKPEHGGIHFQTTTIEGVEWLKQDNTWKAFLDLFSGGGVFKDRVYSVIAEYALMAFDVKLEASGIQALERVNGLAARSVKDMQWLKNPLSRQPGQQTVFLEMVCRTPEAANHLIKSGAALEGQAVRRSSQQDA